MNINAVKLFMATNIIYHVLISYWVVTFYSHALGIDPLDYGKLAQGIVKRRSWVMMVGFEKLSLQSITKHLLLALMTKVSFSGTSKNSHQCSDSSHTKM